MVELYETANQFRDIIMKTQRKMVGPEGLPNSKKISSLTPCGTNTPFYKNQWLSKAAVPLFPAVSAPSFPVVLLPGRRA